MLSGIERGKLGTRSLLSGLQDRSITINAYLPGVVQKGIEPFSQLFQSCANPPQLLNRLRMESELNRNKKPREVRGYQL